MSKKRAAIYVRLSDDKKKTGENVADQEKAARKIAKKKRAEVFDVYCDNSRTASDPKRKPRPDFLRLMEDAEAGRFDMVICRHVDRFFRHPSDQLRVAEVFGVRGITIHQEWAGYPVDVSTPSGLLNLGIAAQVALYEINHKRERQLAYTKKRLKKGKPLAGGPRPFGFKKSKKGKLTPHPTEAPLVREATKHVLEGGSIGELVRSWNAQGIPATRGGTWGYTSMRALLLRWSNAGIRQETIVDPVTGKRTVEEAGPGNWEALVSEEDFRALRKKLQSKDRIKHQGDTGRKHLLSHIIKCAKCGQPMRGASTKTRGGKIHWFYQCPGLKTKCRLAVDYDAAEEAVIDQVAKRLASPEMDLVIATSQERDAATTMQRRLVEIEREEIELENGGASFRSKQRQLAALNDEQTELNQRLATLTQRMTVGVLLMDLTPEFKQGRYDSIGAAVKRREEVREKFATLGLDHRRTVIRALMTVEAVPALRGVRPTKQTAKERVMITPLSLEADQGA